jgi:hypothetical protein
VADLEGKLAAIVEIVEKNKKAERVEAYIIKV